MHNRTVIALCATNLIMKCSFKKPSDKYCIILFKACVLAGNK